MFRASGKTVMPNMRASAVLAILSVALADCLRTCRLFLSGELAALREQAADLRIAGAL